VFLLAKTFQLNNQTKSQEATVTTGWSIDAHRRHKAAASARAAYRVRLRRQTKRMKKGPYLVGDRVVIPSEWYSEEAKAFWRNLGARWDSDHPHGPSWVLNTKINTYAERRWSASAWLKGQS